MLERKVARLQGERSDEEREALAEKIKILNEQYENLADTKVFLEDQMKKLNDDLRRGERELSKSTDEKDYLATKIDELNLHNDSSQRSLKKMTSEKDDLMVCESCVFPGFKLIPFSFIILYRLYSVHAVILTESSDSGGTQYFETGVEAVTSDPKPTRRRSAESEQTQVAAAKSHGRTEDRYRNTH